MADSTRTSNRLAFGTLVFGKVLGIAGLAVASAHQTLGGALLGLDALFIALAVVICLRTMKEQAAEDSSHKALLRQMMKEGTLKQHLRDLEAELAGDGRKRTPHVMAPVESGAVQPE